jgi:formylglycine-generating enzyme required for sulfatase activity
MTSGWQQAAEVADLTMWLDKATPIVFRYVVPDCFQMGSRGESAHEEPLHQVRITQPFFLGTFPVTQAQWRLVVEQFPDSGLESDPSHFKGDARPVEQVSWDDAVAWV